jgi:hypothetical protein
LTTFFNVASKLQQSRIDKYVSRIAEVLDAMTAVFVDDDALLRQIGMAVLYFYLFRRAIVEGKLHLLHREAFIRFDDGRRQNRSIAEVDIARADYRLLEFDRLTQSPNDAYVMRLRLAVIDEIAFGGQLGFPPPVSIRQ